MPEIDSYDWPDSPDHPGLKRLRVDGGYIDGIDLPFAPGGNVLCGAPGVGKSTALALMRFVLDLPLPASKREEFDSLIVQNLGAGRAYLTLATTYGVDYVYSRGAGDAAPRLESPKSAAGDKDTATPSPRDLIPFRFAGHGEFLLMAKDGLARLELIERFAWDDLQRVRADLARVRTSLADNAVDLVRLDRESETLRKTCAKLPTERALLDELKRAGGGDPVDLAEANQRKALRERERMMLEGAVRDVAWLGTAIGDLVGEARRRFAPLDADTLARGANADLLVDVAASIQRIRDAVEASATRVAGETESARAIFAERGRALADRHVEGDDALRAILAKHETNAARAFQRMELEKRVAELTKTKEELDARSHERERMDGARDVLRAAQRKLLAERYALLDGAGKYIKKATNGLVAVEIDQEAERTKYRALLGNILQKKRFEKDDLDVVAANITPDELFAQVVRRDASILAEKLGSETVAGRLIVELLASQRIYELETVEMEDVPRIQLLHGGEYKDSATLSSGQRTIAFVSILLLDKRGPLIADQPEDNVSNKYVAEHLCRVLVESQDKEQFIFVTHNGNIPILGKAQRVFELDADGKHGWVAARGDAKSLQEPMENNFEGGREAFVVRKEFYEVE